MFCAVEGKKSKLAYALDLIGQVYGIFADFLPVLSVVYLYIIVIFKVLFFVLLSLRAVAFKLFARFAVRCVVGHIRRLQLGCKFYFFIIHITVFAYFVRLKR